MIPGVARCQMQCSVHGCLGIMQVVGLGIGTGDRDKLGAGLEFVRNVLRKGEVQRMSAVRTVMWI